MKHSVLLASLLLAACGDSTDETVVDAGGTPDIADAETAPDAKVDAGDPDARDPDAGDPDASPDASPDAGDPDARPDASPDAGDPDASPDADIDAPPADPLAERSGTRLHLTWLESAGGRARYGVRDTQLGVDCVFAIASDAVLRCLPAQPAQPVAQYVSATEERVGTGWIATRVAVGADGSRVILGLHDTSLASDCFVTDSRMLCEPPHVMQDPWYSDAKCTTVRAGLAAQPGYPAFVKLEGTCKLHRLGAQTAPSTRYMRPRWTASCVEVPPGPGETFHELGAEVEPAHGTRVLAGDGAVRELVVEANGEARARAGWVDAARDATCAPTVASDGVLRCMTVSDAVIYDYYRDAKCTEPVTVALTPSKCNGGLPLFALRFEIVDGVARARQFKLGNRFPARNLWIKFGATCAHVAMPHVGRLVGEEEAPETIPAVRVVVE